MMPNDPNVTLSYPMIPLGNFRELLDLSPFALWSGQPTSMFFSLWSTKHDASASGAMLLSCCFSLVNASLRKISGPNSNRVGCYSWRPCKSSRRLARNSTQEFMSNLPYPVCFAICQCNARSMPTQCHCLMTR